VFSVCSLPSIKFFLCCSPLVSLKSPSGCLTDKRTAPTVRARTVVGIRICTTLTSPWLGVAAGKSFQLVSNQIATKLREDIEALKKVRAHRGLRHYWGLKVRACGRAGGRCWLHCLLSIISCMESCVCRCAVSTHAPLAAAAALLLALLAARHKLISKTHAPTRSRARPLVLERCVVRVSRTCPLLKFVANQ
jgi:hypothetical protein